MVDSDKHKQHKQANANRRVDLLAQSTQQSVLSVLMTSPELRGDLLQRYPGRSQAFFGHPAGQSLLAAIMLIPGLAYPADVEARLAEPLTDEWSPQRIFDYAGPDAGLRFWENVEHLRALAKKRALIQEMGQRLRGVAGCEDVDVYARETNDAIARITAETSARHDPRLAAVAERYDRLRAEGRIGRRVPTGIARLDNALGGGLRVDPGELVGIAGHEKQRKTSTALSLAAAWHRQGLEGGTVWICNEESLDSVDLFCQLWAMQATYLSLTRAGPSLRPDLKPKTFSREDVAEHEWAGADGQLVEEAKAIVRDWDIRLYCAGNDDGNSMDFEAVMAQALAEIEFRDATRVVVDNFHGWRSGAESDYDVMNRTVPRVAALTGRYHCLTLALSQYSRKGDVRGSGGFEGRANLVLGVSYDEQDNAEHLEVVKKYGRNRAWFKLTDLRIEPRSGLIIDGLYHGTL